MSVAQCVSSQLERASWIRRMFEEGLRLKAERGAENVFDFSLGNPQDEPPEKVMAALRRIVAENRPHSHGYMPNAGFPEVREVIARRMCEATGLRYSQDHILMTVGSAGAINTFLKAVLDPGDEVIVPLPCFSEYPFYIANHHGTMAPVETREDFSLDVGRIEAAVTPRTKAIIINSPHNPTGVIYSEQNLHELDDLLSSLDHPVTVISDEPYKALTFESRKVPETAAIISRTATCYSWSKALALSGERIGFLALSPRIPEWNDLRNACTFTQRVLGYINAPAIWQWTVAEAGDAAVDVAHYQEKRDILWSALTRMGYDCMKPEATFYLFPRSPIPDDVAFVRLLQQEGVLAVPGSGFGRAGYIRISLTVPLDTVVRSLPGFEAAIRNARER